MEQGILEAVKKRFAGDTNREAASDEVSDLMLRYDIVKKLDHSGLSIKYCKYMRLSAAEKQDIIHLVDYSDLGVNRTLRELGIHKNTFYKCYKAYTDKGIDGLQPPQRGNRQQWNTIPQEQKNVEAELA